MHAVRDAFRPEFLNRLDDILIFHRLTRENMSQIVDIQLNRLQRRLDEYAICLDVDSTAKKWLGDKGYDPMYGARPLKRVMQRTIQDPLATKILGGEIMNGQTIQVTVKNEELDFKVIP